jgi:hypothetical protein
MAPHTARLPTRDQDVAPHQRREQRSRLEHVEHRELVHRERALEQRRALAELLLGRR